MAKARLTVEDVQEMSMEEIARRLKRAGWDRGMVICHSMK